MKQILPGIYRIGLLGWNSLPENMVLKGLSKTQISISTALEMIPLVGTPKCTVSESFVGKKPKEEVNLSFSSTEKLQNVENKALVIYDVNEGVFAIGDKDWPHPEVKMELSSGDPKGDASKFDYKVKWTADLALIPVTVTNQ